MYRLRFRSIDEQFQLTKDHEGIVDCRGHSRFERSRSLFKMVHFPTALSLNPFCTCRMSGITTVSEPLSRSKFATLASTEHTESTYQLSYAPLRGPEEPKQSPILHKHTIFTLCIEGVFFETGHSAGGVAEDEVESCSFKR